MRFYPDVPSRRHTTIAADAAVVLALLVLVWLGIKVHDGVLELTSVTQGVRDVGGAVEGSLDAAADAVGDAPIVGGSVSDALREAGDGTGGEAVAAADEGERDINRLANLLGWLTFLIPAALLLSRFAPPRVAQVRRLTAAATVLREPTDPARRALIAQRAAFGLPFATLLPHTRDPLGDLAAERYDGLVTAALEDAGLRA